METICSKIAGGMLEDGDAEYVVGVKCREFEQLFKVKPSKHNQDAKELMEELSTHTGCPVKETIVTVYCMCVGVDGSKMEI